MVKEVLKVSPETGGAYEAPQCEVMELQMEGVLCQSGSGIEPVEPGDDLSPREKRRY